METQKGGQRENATTKEAKDKGRSSVEKKMQIRSPGKRGK